MTRMALHGRCAICLSNQIQYICHKCSTRIRITIHEFALRLAGQTGDNFALMSARVYQTMQVAE